MPQAAQSSTYSWALTGIFAALHAMMSLIPFSMLIGGEGFLTMGLITAPLIGFLLGPGFGSISVLIGSFIVSGVMNLGGILGPIVPVLAPTAGALVAGLLRTDRKVHAILIYILGIEAFLLSPIAVYALEYLWFQAVCLLLVVLLMIPRIADVFNGGIGLSKSVSPLYWTVSIWLLSLIAVVGDSLIGGAVSAYYLVYVSGFQDVAIAQLYRIAVFVYPVERLIASIVITIAILTLGKSLERASLPTPTDLRESQTASEFSSDEINDK